MKVSEIFYSIQGEGQRVGLPCIFIRFHGCNFKCKWCDTKYAREGGKFKKMTNNEILKEIQKYPAKYICLTGGEPLLQKKIEELVELLRDEDYKIEINTNGSLPLLSGLTIKWTVDFKLPSSGMFGRFNWDNLKKLEDSDDIVMVIKNKEDYVMAREMARAIKAIECEARINFSPCWEEKKILEPKTLVDWMKIDNLDFVRLNIQIHKVIWGYGERGV